MKILWVKTDFLHPTTRGGQIRTLEMLRELHKQHEVHYVAFEDPSNPEGLRRSSEYATQAYPVAHQAVSKRSPLFALQLIEGLFSQYPVAGLRYRSNAMRKTIARLGSEHQFDAKVCDFLTPSINIDSLRGWVLFQHNVETVIWERHSKSGRTALHRKYFQQQARRMFEWERAACQASAHVVAVSKLDEQIMRDRFEIHETSAVSTGVDLEYFGPPSGQQLRYDLVFLGSMDWMPNISGMQWFLSEVLPLIRIGKPDVRVAVVGRNPPASLTSLADSHVTVTGTVADVRPYLWQSAISIVPLQVGGGTRLKIFEAMAAETAVVSTAVGAEGLPVKHGETILIADDAPGFARECLALLNDLNARTELVHNALSLIKARFSWAQVTRDFAETLHSVQASATRVA